MGGLVSAIGSIAGAATGSSWLGPAAAVAGGFLGGGGADGGGGAPQQNSGGTINSAPWGPQQGYLTGGFANASGLFANPSTFFPGQTYANFSPETQQALDLTTQAGLSGQNVDPYAQQQMDKTLKGDYLYGGAGFDAALQAAQNRILPMVDSKFAQGGRYGSGLARTAETSALADSFASQYGQERTNQQNAMKFAPEMATTQANLNYKNIAALAGVGAQKEGMAQSAINEAMARHDFAQQSRWGDLAKYMSMIEGNYGNTQTNTGYQTGFAGNRGAGILGGALSGLQLAGLLQNSSGG